MPIIMMVWRRPGHRDWQPASTTSYVAATTALTQLALVLVLVAIMRRSPRDTNPNTIHVTESKPEQSARCSSLLFITSFSGA
jgi:hypothetical protein